MKFAKFQSVKNKALSMRLFHYVVILTQNHRQINIRIMFERTKVLSKKSSLRDKNHQIPPSLRDFSVFNHAMRNFYCTFAPVLGKATNKTEE